MSTHYTAAGGMPLAFTQEDFLVYNVIKIYHKKLMQILSRNLLWAKEGNKMREIKGFRDFSRNQSG